MQYNTTSNIFEYYADSQWRQLGGSTSLGACTSAERGVSNYLSASQVWRYCNGTNWISMSVQATTATCTKAGQLEYSPGANVMRFCNGTNWIYTAAVTHGYFVLSSYASRQNGNLGGISGAAAKCLTNLNGNNWRGKVDALARGLLNSTKVRVFLSDGTTCTNGQPSKVYVLANSNDTSAGGSKFTTDASGVGPGDAQNWSVSAGFDSATTIWMGRAAGTAAAWGTTSDPATCTGFTAGTVGATGSYGESNRTTQQRWNMGTASTCDQPLRYICFVDP